MIISEIALNIYEFVFQQTLDTSVTSNYERTKWKATIVSGIYNKASDAILGYQSLPNAKVT